MMHQRVEHAARRCQTVWIHTELDRLSQSTKISTVESTLLGSNRKIHGKRVLLKRGVHKPRGQNGRSSFFWGVSNPKSHALSSWNGLRKMGSKHRRRNKSPRQHASANKDKASSSASDHSPIIDKQTVVVGDPAADELLNEVVSGEWHRQERQGSTAAEGSTGLSDTVAPVLDAEKGPSQHGSPQEEPAMSIDQAKPILELLFVCLLSANVSPLVGLKATANTTTSATEVEALVEDQLLDTVALLPEQRQALRAFSVDGNVGLDALVELAGAATFRTELLEFQIRQAILDKASSKSRNKVDVQRTLAKISSSLTDEATIVTVSDFQTILEEKLGVAADSSLLLRVVFARIITQRFAHRVPKRMECSRSSFFAALESFVAEKPLSMVSVEGQLRHLVSCHADLRASFQAFDSDQSGSISLDEFVSFLQREARMQYPREVLSAFIQRFDIDGDGTLSYDEFVKFVSPQQFGIQVLTPFGLFFQAADRRERMRSVLEKIRTRMFWMQHNDLFATSTQPVLKAPLKLKVTDHFVMMHHYGTLRVVLKDADPIAKVLSRGEMVVLVLESDNGMKTTRTSNENDRVLPEFQYRLIPKCKRTIPALLSWSLREATQSSVRTEMLTRSAPQTKATEKRKLSTVSRSMVRATVSEAGDTASITSTKSRRPSSPRSMRAPLASADFTVNTAKQQRRKQRNVSELNLSTEEDQLQSLSPPHTTAPLVETAPSAATIMLDDSTDYAFYEHQDSDDAGSCERDDSGDDFITTSTTGDESAPPPRLCVADDLPVDCDEEPPPPGYYDGA